MVANTALRIFVKDIRETDVLLGHSPRFRNHIGNIRFREQVAARSIEYNGATKQQKTKITWEIINETKRQKGRFLKATMYDKYVLEEQDDCYVRDLVSTRMRDERKKKTNCEDDHSYNSDVNVVSDDDQQTLITSHQTPRLPCQETFDDDLWDSDEEQDLNVLNWPDSDIKDVFESWTSDDNGTFEQAINEYSNILRFMKMNHDLQRRNKRNCFEIHGLHDSLTNKRRRIDMVAL